MAFNLGSKSVLYVGAAGAANEGEIMKRALSLLIAVVAASTVSAQVYTWRDASGKVHYSDTPPPGVDAKQVRGGVPSGADGGAQRRSLNEQEQDFRKRRTESAEKQAKSEKELAEAEARRQDCERARAQLQALESGQRVTRFNDKGEAVFLDDAERAQEIERVRKAVGQQCKP
jgi:hypothetical protein